MVNFQLLSTSFEHKNPIPAKHSCKGSDISPQLSWNGFPAETLSFALIMDDPDAPSGTWVHWVYFNIPPTTTQLAENFPRDRELPDGSRNGKNSWGKTGYNGPCPPTGTHRYFFKLYALDTKLNLDSNTEKTQLLKSIQGHILAMAELMGTFSK